MEDSQQLPDTDDLARKIARELAAEQRERKRIDDLIDGIIAAHEAQEEAGAQQAPTVPQLATLIERADKGAVTWWKDLDDWWIENCNAYTWRDLAEKTGYSQQRLKQELTPKRDARADKGH